jgi:hypothetical protein
LVQNREAVAELIIDDELLPSPVCPQCRTAFSQRALHLFTDTAECAVCRGAFRLSDLVDAASTTSVAAVPPEGIIVSDRLDGWILMASSHSVGNAFETWIFSTAWVGSLILLRAGGGGLIWCLLLAFTPLWVAKAVLQTWGHYAISVQGSTGAVFTGVGRVGWKRMFNWEALRTVSLRTERAGHSGVRKSIVLDSDRKIRFGEVLSDEQRTFVATFLVARTSSWKSKT